VLCWVGEGPADRQIWRSYQTRKLVVEVGSCLRVIPALVSKFAWRGRVLEGFFGTSDQFAWRRRVLEGFFLALVTNLPEEGE
jgi:hypothetical protein